MKFVEEDGYWSMWLGSKLICLYKPRGVRKYYELAFFYDGVWRDLRFLLSHDVKSAKAEAMEIIKDTLPLEYAILTLNEQS